MKTFNIIGNKFVKPINLDNDDEFFAGIFSIGFPVINNLKYKIQLISNFNISKYLISENFDIGNFKLVEKYDFIYFIQINKNLYGFYSLDFINGIYYFIEEIYKYLNTESLDIFQYIQILPFDRNENFYNMKYVRMPNDIGNVITKYTFKQHELDDQVIKSFRNLDYDVIINNTEFLLP
jgi:hypothetical protein